MEKRASAFALIPPFQTLVSERGWSERHNRYGAGGIEQEIEKDGLRLSFCHGRDGRELRARLLRRPYPAHGLYVDPDLPALLLLAGLETTGEDEDFLIAADHVAAIKALLGDESLYRARCEARAAQIEETNAWLRTLPPEAFANGKIPAYLTRKGQ